MNSIRKISELGIVILLCIVDTSIIHADVQGKGVVRSIRDGDLERYENNLWHPIVEGREVSNGDRLRTDKSAVAVFEFPEVGKFVMGPSSEIELGKDKLDFNSTLDRGAVWLKSSLPKGSKASFTTSIATAGVRGTAYSMVFGEGEKAVCVCTCSGEVEAETKHGQKIKVPKGEYLAIAADDLSPVQSKSSLSLLDTKGSVFDFCFNCHTVGGKGALRPDSR